MGRKMKKMISHEDISSICLELSLLLHAGIGVGDALALLLEESSQEYEELLTGIAKEVDEGAALSAALRNTGRFPVYVAGLVEVGEQAGRTEEALRALSGYYEYRTRLDRRVRSALLYPAVMLMLMLIAVLLIKVVPIFEDVYRSLGGRLTGMAGSLLSLGRLLDRIMPVLWVLLAAFVLFFGVFAVSGAFREKILSWWRNLWGDKGIAGRMNTARLAQALSMGMSSGLSLEEAVALAAGLVEDVPDAKKRCMDCRDRLEKGGIKRERALAGGIVPLVGIGPAQRLRGCFYGEDCPGYGGRERSVIGRNGRQGGTGAGAGMLYAGRAHPAVCYVAINAYNVYYRLTGG